MWFHRHAALYVCMCLVWWTVGAGVSSTQKRRWAIVARTSSTFWYRQTVVAESMWRRKSAIVHEKKKKQQWRASKASKLAYGESKGKSESFLHSLSFIEKTFTIFRHGKKGSCRGGSASVYYPSEPWSPWAYTSRLIKNEVNVSWRWIHVASADNRLSEGKKKKFFLSNSFPSVMGHGLIIKVCVWGLFESENGISIFKARSES